MDWLAIEGRICPNTSPAQYCWEIASSLGEGQNDTDVKQAGNPSWQTLKAKNTN